MAIFNLAVFSCRLTGTPGGADDKTQSQGNSDERDRSWLIGEYLVTGEHQARKPDNKPADPRALTEKKGDHDDEYSKQLLGMGTVTRCTSK